MAQQDLDGRIAQGWGGTAPDGVHVNVVLARRGSPTAATITNTFTAPAAGFTPILACLGPDQPSYVTLNPPTIIMNKLPAETELQQALVSGAAQVGISQGVLDTVADGLLEADQETILLVSLWVDPAAEYDTAVRQAARTATSNATREAITGLPEKDRRALVDQREELTHPFYNGN